MALAVGDVGSEIDITIREVNDQGYEQDSTFDTDNDIVTFVFKFSDGTRVAQTGTWVTASRAKYVTVANDIAAAGRCELQLQVDGSGGSGWSGSTEVLVIEIEKKL